MLAAPFAGSVLGVLVRRLPAGRPVGLARSACEACGRPLTWIDLVPLLSFAVLQGRCRTCRARIAPFHWHIEAAAIVVAGWVVSVEGGGPVGWADCVLGWALLALAWIDWQHRRLPDALTLPLVLLGLGATWWLEPDAMLDNAVGAMAGFSLFWLVRVSYRALRGREGLGLGDAKLLAAAGAWVGWQGLDSVVLLGALASIALALLRRQTLAGSLVVPFGPGLALATLAVRLHL